MTLSGYNKASGHELVASAFCNLVRFSGQKRFVYLYLTCAYNSICADLISSFKYDDIINYQLLCLYNRLLSVTHDCSVRRVQHSKLVQHLFSTNLLYNTDQCVSDNDRQESQIPERADQNQ